MKGKTMTVEITNDVTDSRTGDPYWFALGGAEFTRFTDMMVVAVNPSQREVLWAAWEYLRINPKSVVYIGQFSMRMNVQR